MMKHFIFNLRLPSFPLKTTTTTTINLYFCFLHLNIFCLFLCGSYIKSVLIQGLEYDGLFAREHGEVQGSLASHSKCEPLFDSSFNKQILTTIKSPLNLLNERMMSLFVMSGLPIKKAQKLLHNLIFPLKIYIFPDRNQ